MNTTKRGTPRKRPYDVKRKLVRAVARDKKLENLIVTGTFGNLGGDLGETWRCESRGRCLISSYLVGRPKTTYDVSTAAAEGLGLNPIEVESIIVGFDTVPGDAERERYLYHFGREKWFDLGHELRALADRT